jgi:glutathione S-transferase
MFSLFVYFWSIINVGRARGKHQVQAPSTEGPEEFTRVIRGQINTVEGLMLFLPSLWLFAFAFGDILAAIIGVFFPIARILYALGYYSAAEKRSLGFTIGSLVTLVLMIGALVGMIMMLL